MSKIFNHTPQQLGSTTSPVEDLALEVADAFDLVEDMVDVSKSTILTFKDALGNPLFQDLKQHGITADFSESHTLLKSESDIVLENIPDPDQISVSYIDNSTSSTVTLTKVDADSDFTDKDQYKILGKVLRCNITTPSSGSITVNVEYRTKSFDLGGKKILPNVLKKEDGTFLIEPVLVSGTTYNLDFEFDLSSVIDDFVLKSGDTLHFFYTEDSEEFTKLDVSDYNVNSNIIDFTATNLPASITGKVLVFVKNTSISKLLNSLYKEFINHTHSNDNITQNIKHKDVVDRYVNTDTISYKDGDLPNYEHPQYLNREGYNNSLDAVYNNAMLGDLFLSRIISSTVQKYKGLDGDSNSVIFGDPTTGPRLRYERDKEGLTLSSLAPLNGLSILTDSDTKYSLALNNSKLYSDAVNGLRLKPENRVLDVRSETPEKTTAKFDKILAESDTTLKGVQADRIKINDVFLDKDADNTSLAINAQSATNPKLNINVPTNITNLHVTNFKSDTAVAFGGIGSSTMKVGDVEFVETPDGVDTLDRSSSADKIFNYTLPLKADNATIQTLSVTKAIPKTISMGDITIEGNSDPANNGIVLKSSNQADSDITFESDVVINRAKVDKLEAEKSSLKAAISDIVSIGNVELKKENTGNLIIEGKDPSARVIIRAPLDVTQAFATSTSTIDLDTIVTSIINLGKHKIYKDGDGNVVVDIIDRSVVGNEDSTFTFNSKTVINDLKVGHLHGENNTANIYSLTADNIRVGNSKLINNSGITVIQPDTPDSDRLLVHTNTEFKKAFAEELFVEEMDLTSGVADSFKIGKVVLSKNLDNNLEVTGEDNETKVLVHPKTEFDDLKAAKANITLLTTQGTVSDYLKLGNIQFQKKPGENDAQIVRTDDASVLEISAPVKAADFTATNFGTTNNASLTNVIAETITINGFTIRKKDATEDIELINENQYKFSFETPVYASKFYSSYINTNELHLQNKDKISINADNFLTNHNSRFVFRTERPVDFSGSSQNSGIAFSTELGGTPAYRQYVSANSGAEAVNAEKNMFVELNLSNGLYFLKPTSEKISYNGVLHGFNDSTAQKNISDLRQWFRSDIYAGKIGATDISLMPNEPKKKNGLRIGDTRLSVIGPENDCPTGMTILESLDSIHMVKPLNDTQDCTNLTYQAISTGPINTLGNIAVDGNITATEDLLVSGQLAGTQLTVTQGSELYDLDVAGTLSVAGEAVFLAPIVLKNDLSMNSDLNVSGTTKLKSLEVDLNGDFKKDLDVDGDLSVKGNTSITGNLKVAATLETSGEFRSRSVETRQINGENLSLLGELNVAGESVLQGKVSIRASSEVQGNLNVGNSLNVGEAVTANNIYSIKDTSVRGKLTVEGGVDLTGRTINIGGEATTVQLNGRLHFNTSSVQFNSPVKMFSTLRVADDAEVTGVLTNKGGTYVESFISCKGHISSESNISSNSSVIAKSLEASQNLTVGNSITANNIALESADISGNASIASLTVTKALSMPTDTSIVAGEARFSGLRQTDTNSQVSIAGEMILSNNVDALKNVNIGGVLSFDTSAVQISGSGIVSKYGQLDMRSVLTQEISGKQRIQAPARLAETKQGGAAGVARLISEREFVKMGHMAVQGISVFAEPIVANTIYYNDLIFTGDYGETNDGSINILARECLYA